MASLQNVSLMDLPQNTLEEYAKTLEAERARADDTERMYETLKKIHEECTEEFRVAQNQTQKFYVEIEQKLQQSDETIRELRRTIVEQVREISELKSNALTPQREEVIKLNIQTELEKEFHGRNRNFQEENTTLRTKIASLTYENSALRADLEARDSDFSRTKNDLVAKYERKINDLKREKEAEIVKVPAVDMTRYRQLQRDNDLLDLQLKALQSELERLRTEYAKREEEVHLRQKTQMKKIAENTMLVDNLKAEKDTSQRQLDSLRKQSADIMAENGQLNQKVQTVQDEKLAIQEEMEGLIHQQQIQLGAERTKALTEKTNLQKELHELHAEVEKTRAELAVANEGLNLQRKTLAAKEHENQMKISQIKQEHATDYALLEQKKHELDIRVADAEAIRRDVELKYSLEKEVLGEQLQQAKMFTVSLQKEADELRGRIDNYQRMETDFRRAQLEHTRLQGEVKDLLHRIDSMEETFRLLHSERDALEAVISRWKERQLQDEKEIENLKSAHTSEVAVLQKEWMEKSKRYGEQIKEKEDKLSTATNAERDLAYKLGAIEGELSLQKMRSQTVISELITALRAKSKLLDTAKNNVSAEEHAALKKELGVLREKLGRLKSLTGSKPSNLDATVSQPIQTYSVQKIESRLDKSLRPSSAAALRTELFQDETVEQILDRLTPLGLLENGTGKLDQFKNILRS
ncbi:hypothetical protein RvY_05539-2 [Ramazzottius varieornatus]|uniref:Uncharacterized protein n=1 Tax=Ramazzottius varieornatus TaxID=947166 RepID=A0A1D1UVB7_RAMVA|nr:hypothetical protein RvY_05539-2 [Ramazzottius varieornatus]